MSNINTISNKVGMFVDIDRLNDYLETVDGTVTSITTVKYNTVSYFIAAITGKHNRAREAIK